MLCSSIATEGDTVSIAGTAMCHICGPSNSLLEPFWANELLENLLENHATQYQSDRGRLCKYCRHHNVLLKRPLPLTVGAILSSDSKTAAGAAHNGSNSEWGGGLTRHIAVSAIFTELLPVATLWMLHAFDNQQIINCFALKGGGSNGFGL